MNAHSPSRPRERTRVLATVGFLILVTSRASADGWTGVRSAVAGCGDVDGDGTGDVIVASRDYRRPERAWVLSGKDGAVLLELMDRPESSGFGAAVGRTGDLDGDGRDEIWVAARGWPLDPRVTRTPAHHERDRSHVRVFSGRTGRLIREVEDTEQIAGDRDLDADGVADLLFAQTPTRKRVPCIRVQSGAKGTTLLELPVERDRASRVREGGSLSWIADVNADGLPDVAVSAVRPSDASRAVDVSLHSGRNGAVIWQFVDRDLRYCDASILRDLGDVNGDGAHDLLLGVEDRYALALCGKSGAQLWKLSAVRHVLISWGSSLDVLGDVDRDGVTDWLCGANEAVPNAFDSGQVIVASGRTGEWLRTIQACDHFGLDASRVGDVDRDGVPDVAVVAERHRTATDDRRSEPSVQVISGATGRIVWQRLHVDLRESDVPHPR